MSNAVNNDPSPFAGIENAPAKVTKLKTQGPRRGVADLDAIKRLDALAFGLKHNLIYLGSGTAGASNARYAFTGEKNAAIEFFNDGKFHYHKLEENGTAIDLVRCYLAGLRGRDYEPEPNNRDFGEAVEFIAEAEGLKLDWAPKRDHGETLAGAYGEDSDKFEAAKKRAYGVAGLTHGEEAHALAEASKKPWAEALKFLKAVGIDPNHLTLAATSDSGLCFAPSAPCYQEAGAFNAQHGPYISTKTVGEYVMGGWSKNALEAGLSGPGGGLLHYVDLDGAGRKPLIKALHQLVRGLESRGLKPVAFNFSSFDPSDPDRAKAHIYFKASKKARSVDEWLERQQFTFDTVKEVAQGIDQPQEERDALAPDKATLQISRLMRLAGFAKHGRKYAAQVYKTWAGRVVDYDEAIEAAPVIVDLGKQYPTRGKPHLLRYVFGDDLVKYITPLEDSEDGEGGLVPGKERWVKLGGFIRPDANTVDIAAAEPTAGVGVKFKNHAVGDGYIELGAGLLTSARGFTSAGEQLGAAGVAIQPRRGSEVAEAIAYWASGNEDKTAVIVSQNGWFTDPKTKKAVFVNGPRVYGADWRANGPSITRRAARKGTLAEWKSNIEGVVKTPAQAFALGLSFAGTLVGGLAKAGVITMDSFGVNFHGRSSSGKSRTAQIAASVWGMPDGAGSFSTWNSTVNAIEEDAESRNGSLLVLDEAHKVTAYGAAVRVKQLASNTGKKRLNTKGEAIKSRSWGLCIISTSEPTLKSIMGEYAQGGHAVRMPDIRLEVGEACLSPDHAREVRREVTKAYGVAGDAWGAYLASFTKDDWAALQERAEAHEDTLRKRVVDAEAGRIAGQWALVVAALEHAEEAGIFKVPEALGSPLDIGLWATDKVIEERGEEVDPSARLLAAIKREALTSQANWPTELYLNSPSCSRFATMHGIQETIEKDKVLGAGEIFAGVGVKTGRLYFTDSTLEASGLPQRLGADIKAFKAWLQETGQGGPAEEDAKGRAKKIRIAGERQRWYVIDLNAGDKD